MSASFTKDEYEPGEPIGVRYALAGWKGRATGVHFSVTSNVSWGSWGDFDPPGTVIWFGYTPQGENSGIVINPSETTVIRLHIELVSDQEDVNPYDNSVTITAALVHTRSGFSGVVYRDENGNGSMDPSEGFPDVLVDLRGGPLGRSKGARTDGEGRFAFEGVAAGDYVASYFAYGWVIPSGRVTIDGIDNPHVVVLAVPGSFPSLGATAAFAKASYAPGETAHLTVTLTNFGPGSISGITVRQSSGIDAADPGWGDLARGAAGVTIPDGVTRTFDVSRAVPLEALRIGYLDVSVEFGPFEPRIQAEATASARVPGGFAPLTIGRVERIIIVNSVGGVLSEPVPNREISLRDIPSGAVVARAVTDGKGYFEFTNVPAGRYAVHVAGPWERATSQVAIYAGGRGPLLVFVWGGPLLPNPVPSPTPQPPAASPQPGIVPARVDTGGGTDAQTGGLASTGADVVWLTVGAWLALAIGALLLLWRRRGRAAR